MNEIRVCSKPGVQDVRGVVLSLLMPVGVLSFDQVKDDDSRFFRHKQRINQIRSASGSNNWITDE